MMFLVQSKKQRCLSCMQETVTHLPSTMRSKICTFMLSMRFVVVVFSGQKSDDANLTFRARRCYQLRHKVIIDMFQLFADPNSRITVSVSISGRGLANDNGAYIWTTAVDLHWRRRLEKHWRFPAMGIILSSKHSRSIYQLVLFINSWVWCLPRVLLREEQESKIFSMDFRHRSHFEDGWCSG